MVASYLASASLTDGSSGRLDDMAFSDVSDLGRFHADNCK